MSFLSPWLLLGLLGVGVPILIHLLSRYRHRPLDWAAMELLRRAVRVKTRRIRLEDLLLLALRCLIVVLVVLALARPTTQGRSAFGDPDAGMVVMVDGSLSMNHVQGVPRFERAVDRAGQVLATARTGDPTSLLMMADRPEVMLRNTGYQPAKAEQALDQLQPRSAGLNLEAALEEAAGLLADMTVANTELYLVTDAQHGTWANLSDRSRRLLETLGRDHNIFLVPVRDQATDNLAVTQLQLTSGALRQGELVRLTAGVRNFGSTPRTAVRVTLFDGDRIVDRAIIGALPPGGSAAVPFFHRLTEPGPLRLTARIEGDGLVGDNQRHLAIDVRRRVRVLVADGDPFGASQGTAAEFITHALSPLNEAAALSLSVTTVPWLNLPSVSLDRYDLVVLANVPDVPEVTAEALHAWVGEGGGLIVYLGENVRPRVLNERLARGDERLLPAVLRTVRASGGADPTQVGRIDPDIPIHPVVNVLANFPDETVTGSRFFKHMQVDLLPGARALLELAGGDPLLVERPLGRGAVLMFTTSADRSWNDMALSPISPALLHQAATQLLRQAFEQPLTAGEPFALPLPDAAAGDVFELTTPDGRTQTHHAVLRDGRIVLDVAGLDRLGFYEVAVNAEGGWPLAVNADPAESDVRSAAPAELAAAVADLPVRILEPGDDVAAAVQQARIGRELWKYLLAAALVALLIESIVARRYARRPKV